MYEIKDSCSNVMKVTCQERGVSFCAVMKGAEKCDVKVSLLDRTGTDLAH